MMTPFFFDGNQWSGAVDSPAKWRLLVSAYPVLDKLLGAKMAPMGAVRALPVEYHLAAPGVTHGAMPSFGFRREHLGDCNKRITGTFDDCRLAEGHAGGCSPDRLDPL